MILQIAGPRILVQKIKDKYFTLSFNVLTFQYVQSKQTGKQNPGNNKSSSNNYQAMVQNLKSREAEAQALTQTMQALELLNR